MIRSAPYHWITCDDCGAKHIAGLSALVAGWKFLNLPSEVRYYCEDCARNHIIDDDKPVANDQT
jgi:hypothetical protein